MVGGNRVVTALGFAVAAALLAGLIAVVGVDRTWLALSDIDRPSLAIVAALVIAWLAAWGVALHTILGTLGVRVSLGQSLLLYVAAVFANNVTPFGQAGGEPITALFIARTGRTRYETGIAAIASLDALNVVASLALALTGLGAFATTAAFGTRLRTVAAVTVGFAVAVGVLLATVWRVRRRLARRAGRAVAAALRPVARLLPRRSPPQPADVSRRLEAVVRHLEAVVADRRRLGAVLGLLTLGWLLQMAALSVIFGGLGASVPAVALLFVVPVSNLAGIVPLPGGLGGIEAALVALLALTSGAGAAVVTAAVLVFRGGIYWLPVVLGGASAAALGVAAGGEE